jgi:hypothetical protein
MTKPSSKLAITKDTLRQLTVRSDVRTGIAYTLHLCPSSPALCRLTPDCTSVRVTLFC